MLNVHHNIYFSNTQRALPKKRLLPNVQNQRDDNEKAKMWIYLTDFQH